MGSVQKGWQINWWISYRDAYDDVFKYDQWIIAGWNIAGIHTDCMLGDKYAAPVNDNNHRVQRRHDNRGMDVSHVRTHEVKYGRSK